MENKKVKLEWEIKEIKIDEILEELDLDFKVEAYGCSAFSYCGAITMGG